MPVISVDGIELVCAPVTDDQVVAGEDYLFITWRKDQTVLEVVYGNVSEPSEWESGSWYGGIYFSAFHNSQKGWIYNSYHGLKTSYRGSVHKLLSFRKMIL